MIGLPEPVSVPLRSSAAAAGRMLTTVTEGPAGPDNALFLAESGLRLSGGPRRFDAWAGESHVLYVDVDPERWQIGMQGHWWYRGEFQVIDTKDGTRLEHRLCNVADRLRWAVPLANRLFIGHRQRLLHGAHSLAERLDAATGRT